MSRPSQALHWTGVDSHWQRDLISYRFPVQPQFFPLLLNQTRAARQGAMWSAREEQFLSQFPGVSWVPITYAFMVARENELDIHDLRWDLYNQDSPCGCIPCWMPRFDGQLLPRYAVAVPESQHDAMHVVGPAAASIVWHG